MTLNFHQIAEKNHRILNPFTESKLMLLGAICRLKPGMRQLDLACGKAEMLSRWAQTYGIHGVGVDISPVFLAAAHARAEELGVASSLTFVEGDAGKYVAEPASFDVVSCIGATWIGQGLVGTIELMQPALKPGGMLLVGEPFWNEEPPEEAVKAIGVSRDDFASLVGTLDRFESAGVELVEMVLANHDDWDRYEAMRWSAVFDYLRAHPDTPDADELRQQNARNRRSHLEYQRRYLGWGVFVLRSI